MWYIGVADIYCYSFFAPTSPSKGRTRRGGTHDATNYTIYLFLVYSVSGCLIILLYCDGIYYDLLPSLNLIVLI